MRVAVDAGPLLDPTTGVARYTSELIDALGDRGVDVTRYAVAWGGSAPPNVKRWRVPGRAARWSWRRLGRPAIDRLVGDVDLVHATNFVLPALRGIPGIATIHDLSFYRDDVFPGGERLRDLVPWTARRAARIIVPTETIADEVSERLSIGRDRVSVTYEGVGPIFFGASPLSDGALASMGIRKPFALAVGTIEPRKNLPRLLAAWAAARAELSGWTLVLAGPSGWGPELQPVEGVVPLGWVGDETLPGLLAAADLFCYPSLYEGFGLPPLEAMAAGTPVLVGGYSCAAEVVGDAAVIVDPLDVDAWSGALVELAGDPGIRAGLAVAGRARAARFTWESTASATIRAYSEVTGGPRSAP